MRVLIVEDYEPVRKALSRGLTEAGFAVDAAADGEKGLAWALSEDYDVLVLDLMLPGKSGLAVLECLRTSGKETRVLVLTAKDTVADRVRGLDLGADDYLVKPFAFEELLARVRALVRRKYGLKSSLVRVADLEVDLGARTVRRAGERLDLSGREFAILEYLALRAGKIVTRADIWEHVYDFASEPNSNLVDVFVGRLRRKLEDGGRARLIHTRRGIGYVLASPEEA